MRVRGTRITPSLVFLLEFGYFGDFQTFPYHI